MKFEVGDYVCCRHNPFFKFKFSAKPKNSSNIGIVVGIEFNVYRIEWFKDSSNQPWAYYKEPTELNCIKLENNLIVKILYDKI